MTAHCRPQRGLFPLAHWIEQQPWGNQFPEPHFTQSFRIVKAQTAMDVHQMLIAVDANANPADGQSGTAEPLQMLWFNSVGLDSDGVHRSALNNGTL